MKKIAHYVALDDLGGLQTLFMSLARYLADQGTPPIVINRAPRSPLEAFRVELEKTGATLLSPRQATPLRLLAPLRNVGLGRVVSVAEREAIRTEISRLRQREGVTRLVSWNALPSRNMLFAGGDVVLYDHGMSSLHEPGPGKRTRLRLASKVITISNATQRLLEERWEWRGETLRLRNPLRTQIARIPLPPSRELRPTAVTLGCASRLVSFKGIASVIHAIHLLRHRGLEAQLVIAGDGPERQLLTATAHRLGLKDFVRFLGSVDDMANFFSSIDVFVAPSLREPYGLAPLEALSLGLPTILSDVDGHREILPFPAAATLLLPTLDLAHYCELGATLEKMPELVYSPAEDALVSPRALDPQVIAEAVTELVADYPRHAARAHTAGSMIRERHTMSAYCTRFLELVGGPA